MANLGYVSTFNINGSELTLKDAELTEIVNEIVEAIGANNNNIAERINNLHDRSFDAEIKISSQAETEISNIVDGLYKLQYVTITGEGTEATETLNNSAILTQKGTNQYLIKDGQILSRTKTNDTWGTWSSNNVKPDWEATSGSAAEILNKPDLSNFLTIETQPNWNETNTSSAAYIQNKPSSIVTSVNGDTGAVTIQENVQADWNSTTGASQILNKPNIVIENGGNNNSSIIFSPANLNINAGSGYDLNLSGNSVDINGLIFYNGDVVDGNGESVLLKVLNAWSPEYDTTSDIDDITLSNDVYKVNLYELEIDSISNEIISEHLSKGLLIHNDNTQYLIKDNEIKYRVYENNTWSEWQNGTVTSVNGMTGAVTITHPVTSVNGQQGDVTLSIPTVPTTSTTVTENDTNPVSGGAVYDKFEDLIGTAPAALDTLGEIATALNNDADLAGTLTTQISNKIPKVSSPTTDHFASFNSDGTIKDSGHSHSDYVTSVNGQQGAVTLSIPTVNDTTVTLTMNNTTIGTFTLNKDTNTTIDLGTVLTAHQSIKTVNNESLVGTGNIVVSGLPQVSASDNGKILMVVNGQWQLVSPSVLYTGQGVPNNAQGNNGDLYMQTD